MSERQMDLIGNNRLVHRFFEELNLRCRIVADAEITHLATVVQFVESFGDLLRLDERARRVQQQDVQVISSQPLQTTLSGLHNMLARQIYVGWLSSLPARRQYLPALALQYQLMA